MPDEVLRSKIEETLRKSSALEHYWQRPITGEQLQAEMERMAKSTKKPEILEEIFNILNNDPYVIAECLARPALVDRLIRNWYAFDERFHKEIKRKAEADLLEFREVSQMKLMSGKYFETEYVKSEGNTPSYSPSIKGWTPKADGVVAEVSLTVEEWIELKNKLQRRLTEDSGAISRLQEDENRFYVIAVLEEESDRIRVATVEWEKLSFEDWWEEKKFDENSFTEPDFSYSLPSINFGSCTDDTWQSTASDGPPSGRYYHTAVWTGSEMVIWGGWTGNSDLNTGGRYCASSSSASPGTVPDSYRTPGTPLTIAKSGSDLVLSWSAPGGTCLTQDYGIYRGSLPLTSYNYTALLCTTGGLTIATIPADVGNYYYLVVAQNAGFEGSYGVDSANTQRPPAGTICFPQQIGNCN